MHALLRPITLLRQGTHAPQQRPPLARISPSVLIIAVALSAPLSDAAAAAGDAFVYRVVNRYNNETVGHIRHEIVASTAPQGQTEAITVDNTALGSARTDTYTGEGHWLRRPLDNHGTPVGYDFSSALPVVQPLLSSGSTWSIRVQAKVAGEDSPRSVRIDGRVLGHERIRVPAGEFETVRIQRAIYPGDAEYFRSETRIIEIDWYAPALGRSVRTETRSGWRDMRSGCRRAENCDFRGDWYLLELAEMTAATR